MPVKYARDTVDVGLAETAHFTADDRVKLSYHRDGFAQFSGENPGTIASGRKPDGTPKGLAIQTWPLAVPMETGPNFGIQVWGLEGFQVLKGRPKNAHVFGEDDFYYRDCTPDDWHGYLFEGFVFTPHFRAHVRQIEDRILLPLWHRAFGGGEGASFDFRIVAIELQTGLMLALIASRLRMEGDVPECGFVLNGPGQVVDNEGNGFVLMAQYPRSAAFSGGIPLDYAPPASQPSDE